MPLDVTSSMLSGSPLDAATQATVTAGQPHGKSGLFASFLGEKTGQPASRNHALSGDRTSHRDHGAGDHTRSHTDGASVDGNVMAASALLQQMATQQATPFQPKSNSETISITGLAMDTGRDVSANTPQTPAAGGLLPTLSTTNAGAPSPTVSTGGAISLAGLTFKVSSDELPANLMQIPSLGLPKPTASGTASIDGMLMPTTGSAATPKPTASDTASIDEMPMPTPGSAATPKPTASDTASIDEMLMPTPDSAATPKPTASGTGLMDAKPIVVRAGNPATVTHAATTYAVYGWDPASSPLPKKVTGSGVEMDTSATDRPALKEDLQQLAGAELDGGSAVAPAQSPSTTGTSTVSTSTSATHSPAAQAAPASTARIAQALVAPVLVSPVVNLMKTGSARSARGTDATKVRGATGKGTQIALKPDAVDANNSTTGKSPQEFGVRAGVGQTSTSTPAPTSVDTAKKAHTEGEPKAEVTERGKKTETPIDNAMADTRATTVAHDPVMRSANAEAKPLTHAERVELVRQVADQIGSTSLKPGNNQITVNLHPGNWGSVQVKISVVSASRTGGAAQVTAHLMAENTSVKTALDSHMGDLRKALEGAGLHLRDAVVAVQTASSSAQSGSTGSGAGNGSHGHPGSWGADGSRNGAGNTQSQGSFASFAGGGRSGGGSGNSRSYQPAGVEATEAPVTIEPRSVLNGRLDTRA